MIVFCLETWFFQTQTLTTIRQLYMLSGKNLEVYRKLHNQQILNIRSWALHLLYSQLICHDAWLFTPAALQFLSIVWYSDKGKCVDKHNPKCKVTISCLGYPLIWTSSPSLPVWNCLSIIILSIIITLVNIIKDLIVPVNW